MGARFGASSMNNVVMRFKFWIPNFFTPFNLQPQFIFDFGLANLNDDLLNYDSRFVWLFFLGWGVFILGFEPVILLFSHNFKCTLRLTNQKA